jgi:hypothetical protein
MVAATTSNHRGLWQSRKGSKKSPKVVNTKVKGNASKDSKAKHHHHVLPHQILGANNKKGDESQG